MNKLTWVNVKYKVFYSGFTAEYYKSGKGLVGIYDTYHEAMDVVNRLRKDGIFAGVVKVENKHTEM
jgi:hypothetical protein